MRSSRLVVLCFALLTLTPTIGAQGSAAPLRLESNGARQLLFLGEAAFHETSRTVSDLRDIALSDSRLLLWDETDTDLAVTSHYAISRVDGPVSRPRQIQYELRLRYAEFDPWRESPAIPASLAPSPENPLHVVQFHTPPLEEFREALRDLGGEVLHYLPHHAHVVRIAAGQVEAVRLLPFVRWVGAYEPAYRLEPGLLDPAADLPPDQVYNVQVFASRDGRATRQKNRVARRVIEIGGQVVRADAGKHLLEVILTPQQLRQVIGWNEVAFVDRWSPYETDMNLAREIGGANFVESIAGYVGTGVRGEVIDNGFNLTHVDFGSNPLIQHTAVNVESHGSSTSGIVFGDGTGDFSGRGMLPAGQGIVADWDAVSVGTPRYLHTGELVQAPYFAVFQTASVGSTRTLDYTTISADTDAALFDFDIVHCQSQSNAGNQDSRPQAWAKNIISVGGIRHQNTLTKTDDCWNCGPSAASIGPAADGRIKPDLCHFYDNIFTTDSGSNTAYTATFGGTSGATPIVAGHVGLFFEMWSDGVFGNPIDPSGTVFENRCHMTTAKAILVNSASAYPFSGTAHDLTRVHQGWGMPDLAVLYDARERMLVVDEYDLVENLGQVSYEVTVAAGEPALRATLVYADPPGLPSATIHRINDLSLRVTSPTGTVYWGNNGLLEGNWSTSGGTSNTIDTVENVFVSSPAEGTWTVEVLADEINQDSHVETSALDADFALVVSGVDPVSVPLLIRLPDGAPDQVPPGVPTEFAVEILEGSETVPPGNALLHYRFDAGDAFESVPLQHLGGVDYLATLPGASCGSQPQFYVSALGDLGTTIVLPQGAPGESFSAAVGEDFVVWADDFETNQGWTVGAIDDDATTGIWERVDPIGTAAQPEDDHTADPGALCFVTGQGTPGGSIGENDVDGGKTTLTSPFIDLSDGDATIRYWRWYSNNQGAEPNADIFLVEISNDGGSSWTPVEVIGPAGPDTSGGWAFHEFTVSDFVTPTAQIRLRFIASDEAGGSIVEAALDDVEVSRFECSGCSTPLFIRGDADGSLDVSITDVVYILDHLFSGGPEAVPPAAGDVNADDVVDISDPLYELAYLFDGGPPPPPPFPDPGCAD